MAKLYFRYGSMGSSKTANILMVNYNYSERGKRALLVKPSVDTRDGENVVSSRIGLKHESVPFEEVYRVKKGDYDAILVDEAQFLTYREVVVLSKIVDNEDIPVICYGLRTDFKGELFSGSRALFELADTVEEIKTICWCGKKAIMNARIDKDGQVVKQGEQIELGANDRYTGLCRKHWSDGDIGRLED